jgi:hypothetical protein
LYFTCRAVLTRPKATQPSAPTFPPAFREKQWLISVATGEDTILAKLRWSKLSGGSEKQMQDARGVYEVQGLRLDLEYIRYWVQELDLVAEWRSLTEQK